LDFNALREALARAIEDAYTKQADKVLADIDRELGERVKSDDDLGGALVHLLFLLSHRGRLRSISARISASNFSCVLPGLISRQRKSKIAARPTCEEI
jgi:hypothetical protein